MNDSLADSQDRDIRGAEAALRRAAQKARELGERTQTPVYIIRDGKIVNLLDAGDPQQSGEAAAPSNRDRQPTNP